MKHGFRGRDAFWRDRPAAHGTTFLWSRALPETAGTIAASVIACPPPGQLGVLCRGLIRDVGLPVPRLAVARLPPCQRGERTQAELPEFFRDQNEHGGARASWGDKLRGTVGTFRPVRPTF